MRKSVSQCAIRTIGSKLDASLPRELFPEGSALGWIRAFRHFFENNYWHAVSLLISATKTEKRPGLFANANRKPLGISLPAFMQASQREAAAHSPVLLQAPKNPEAAGFPATFTQGSALPAQTKILQENLTVLPRE